MEDEKIIGLYFERNEQAIRETSDKYGGLCMQISENILKNHSDAEECVNDTYLHTWNSIPPTRPRSLGAFVCRIARNLSITRLREKHRTRRNPEFVVALHELEDCIPVPEESLSELSSLLEAFLASEGDLDVKLFMGRYWHGYPVNRMAEFYGMTENAVSSRLHRTRERLRIYLTERGYTL